MCSLSICLLAGFCFIDAARRRYFACARVHEVDRASVYLRCSGRLFALRRCVRSDSEFIPTRRPRASRGEQLRHLSLVIQPQTHTVTPTRSTYPEKEEEKLLRNHGGRYRGRKVPHTSEPAAVTPTGATPARARHSALRTTV
jgi:hypothetical protein